MVSACSWPGPLRAERGAGRSHCWASGACVHPQEPPLHPLPIQSRRGGGGSHRGHGRAGRGGPQAGEDPARVTHVPPHTRVHVHSCTYMAWRMTHTSVLFPPLGCRPACPLGSSPATAPAHSDTGLVTLAGHQPSRIPQAQSMPVEPKASSCARLAQPPAGHSCMACLPQSHSGFSHDVPASVYTARSCGKGIGWQEGPA